MISQTIRDQLHSMLRPGDYLAARDLLEGQGMSVKKETLIMFVTGARNSPRGQAYFDALCTVVEQRQKADQAANQAAAQRLQALSAPQPVHA